MKSKLWNLVDQSQYFNSEDKPGTFISGFLAK